VLTRMPRPGPAEYRVPMRATTASVIGCWVLSAALVATLLALGPQAHDSGVEFVLDVLVALVPLILGAVVARRLPGHGVAPLLSLCGLLFLVAMLPADPLPAALDGAWALLFLGPALLLLVVPDGVLGTRMRRAWAGATTAVALAVVAAAGLDASVVSAPRALEAGGIALVLGYFVLLAGCAVLVVRRYRGADARGRLQLRWVYLTGFSLPLTLLSCWAGLLLADDVGVVAIGLLVIYLTLPAGATVAVLAPARGDVDRAVVAAVTVTVLSLLVLGALTLASVALGTAVTSWSPTAGVVVAALVALLAVPGYRLTRRLVGELVYRERERALRALRVLAGRVEAGEAEATEVERVLRETLADPGLRVGYRGIEDTRLRGADGAEIVPGPLASVVLARGQEIGVISPSHARVKRVAAAVVHASAPLVDAARMHVELARARTEVASSRERMLRAGYEERRRLERDLHDGAQQRLVALGMRLRVLQRGAATDAALASALDGAVAELATAVAELRRIAHGVRPSALDDGLGAALAHLGRIAPTPIDLDVRTGELPDAVSTTAYFVASEAVVNALRHAAASRIRIEVRQEAAGLVVVVSDDGCGGARPGGSGGLTGLQDRVAALGGSLRVESPVGSGTVVRAELPCAS